MLLCLQGLQLCIALLDLREDLASPAALRATGLKLGLGLLLAGATGWSVLGLHLPEALPMPPARALHIWLSGLFAAAFAAHAGAVLWHHFALRDRQLIRRMLR